MLRKTGIFILVISAALFACKTHYSVVSKEAKHQGLQHVKPSQKFDSLIAPYKAQLSAEMEKQLVMCDGDLTKEGAETTIGNFVCDAMKWAYDSIVGVTTEHFVLMNRGGIRANLPKGMVTVNSIFELMPFDNELDYVIIHGREFREVIKRVAEKKHAFKGIELKVDKQGNYTATMKGATIVEDSTYSMICADFVVNGGDDFTFGKKLIHERKMGITLRDAIINYCKHLKFINRTIVPYKDGRFEISK